ncbi:MAG: hypothetical protein JRJ77_13745 [Deltaproteobacteria bacterium]|nr:hypothetical protein [Deltaproteobacteria bacterium]MBW1794207.1 hypothetical protein [Deltaproteobacteria bacterium]
MADAIDMMTRMGTGIEGMSYQMDDKAMEFLSVQQQDPRTSSAKSWNLLRKLQSLSP